jgi:hypothetical protein
VVMAELAKGASAWSAPLTLSTNSGSTDYAFFPWIAYDAVTGDLAVSFYSTAADQTYHEEVDDYLTYSLDDGVTWTAPVAVSSVASDEGPNVTYSNANDYGDYEGVAARAGVAHPVWTDTRNAGSIGEQVFTAAWSMTPAAPSVAISGTAAAASLSWAAVAGATAYNVYGAAGQAPTETPADRLASVTVANATYGGLTWGQQFYFAVSAVNAAGEGGLSAPVPTIPTTAPSVSVTGTTATTTSLAWSTVAGAVYYAVRQGGAAIAASSGTTYQAAGLSASTAYSYTVTAVGLDGVGPASAAVTATTAAAPAVTTVSSAAPSSTSSSSTTVATPGLTALNQQNVGAVIQQAGTAADVSLALSPDSGGTATLSLSSDALAALVGADKGVTATLGGASLTLPPDDLNLQLPGEEGLSLQVLEVPQDQLAAPGVGTPAGGGVTLSLSVSAPSGNAIGAAPTLPRPVRLTLTYAGSGPVAIYWVDGPAGPQAIPGVAGSGTVTADLHHFSTYAPIAVTSAFADTGGSWAAGDIATAAAQGLVEGVGDGLFEPDGVVTRAQLAQLLTRALSLAAAPSTTQFSDVDPAAWYAAAIAAAQSAGLMDGVGGGQFAPEQPVTREQLAAALSRALADLGSSYALPAFRSSTASAFADAARIDPWAAQAASYVAQLGLMQGLPGGAFDPLAPVTRAQAAAVLVRLIGLIEASPLR